MRDYETKELKKQLKLIKDAIKDIDEIIENIEYNEWEDEVRESGSY